MHGRDRRTGDIGPPRGVRGGHAGECRREAGQPAIGQSSRGDDDLTGGLRLLIKGVERARELPTDRPLLVYCGGGYRSSIAASLLQRRGFGDVSEIAGGFTAWETAHLPVESARRPVHG